MSAALDATLVATSWPVGRAGRRARDAVLAFCGALTLAISATVHVPLHPVPMTLQTLVVLVLAGVVAGLAYIAGPTGGYLVCFLADRGWDRSRPRLNAAMTIDHAVIFAFRVAPFALATIVKSLLALALVRAAWGAVAELRKAWRRPRDGRR